MPPRGSRFRNSFPLSTSSRTRRRVAMNVNRDRSQYADASSSDAESGDTSEAEQPTTLGILSTTDEPLVTDESSSSHPQPLAATSPPVAR